MDSNLDRQQQARRNRSYTMVGGVLESYWDQPPRRDIAVQTEESPAPMETTPEAQLAGEPTSSRVVPVVVRQHTRSQSLSQMMGVQLSKPQDPDHDDEKLTIEVETEEMPGSGDMKELSVLQEAIESNLAQILQESEILDNEKNARLEAQMKDPQ